jgi:pimeloyl-ACP methyl ester carboxylesterase
MRPMLARPVSALVLGLALGACGSASPSAGAGTPATAITLPNGSAALVWGSGPYGLVLVHGAAYDAASWSAQADAFAAHGMTVLAVERADADSVASAIHELQDERGVERVAVLAASAGSAAALAVGREQPDLVDQLLLLSGSGDATTLGVFPKLFAASQGEPAASDAERMAAEAPGDWNALYLAPGSAHAQAIFASEGGGALLDALVARLEERR